MSERAADRLGIAPAKRVAFLGGASANDGWSAAERVDLASSPAIRAAARAAQAHAQLGAADVDLFDLYSCFPCAVEFALDALGRLGDRPARPDPDRRTRAPRRAGQQLRDARPLQHRSASAGREGEGRLGLGPGHERHQARGRRPLERPAPDRGVGRTRHPRLAAERRVRGPGAGRRAGRPGPGRELHRHVRPREQARAQRRLPAPSGRPAQRRARRAEPGAVPRSCSRRKASACAAA